MLEAAYQAIQQRQAAVSLAGLEPAEGMRKLIRELFRDFAEVPEFISLLNSENLPQGAPSQEVGTRAGDVSTDGA